MNLLTGRSGVYALLTDGTTIEIRPARPQDRDAVRQMHAAMSPDNIYLRFFTISPNAPQEEADRVCREPDEDHAALLAWLKDQLVGVASYEPSGAPGVAEVAVAVADHMHGRGVATLLLEHLVSVARQRKLTAFTAHALAINAAMLRVLADAGLPASQESAAGRIDLTVPLPYEGDHSELNSYLDRVARRESLADVASLRHIFQPESVAVVGASRRPGAIGHAVLHNIVTGNFAGRLYAVNPRARQIEGVTCVPSVDDLPEPADLAVVAVPAAAVQDVAERCGRRGVRSLIVVTAGLDTVAGAELLAICRRRGMRLVGPNCFGITVPHLGLDATFGAARPVAGEAGLVVQSGGVGVALLDHLTRLGIGVSSFASVGDKYDVSSNDMLMWWERDGRTRLGILYVESFGSPRKFARIARHVGATMPVLTVHDSRLAAGQPAGQLAGMSHTTAAAVALVTRETLFGQAGIVAARSLGELLEAAALLASQPLPAGDRVAVVSNAGGGGVLAADACADSGLRVAALAARTQDRLRRMLPPGATVTNPVDTTAAIPPATFRSCLERVAADDGVDIVLAISVPTALADFAPAITTADVTKTLAAALLVQPEAVRLLPRDGRDAPGDPLLRRQSGRVGPRTVPSYAYLESATRALGHAARYQAWRTRDRGTVPLLGGVREADARALVVRFLTRHRTGGWLSSGETASLLSCYGVPLVTIRQATSEQAAVVAAAELGGRVVLKADVPGLVHKSDAGGVHLDLGTEQDVRRCYQALAGTFGSSLRQVLVQPMISGVEVLIGVTREPVFGPLVVFGLGGVATDVLGDYTARLTPLTGQDADEMIRDVRAAPLLFGHRGTPAADVAALAGTLLRVSQLASDLPEVAELDLDPVIACPGGVSAVDARVRLSPAEPQDPFLRRLR